MVIPKVEFIKTDTGAVTRANSVQFNKLYYTLAVNATLASGTYYVRIENR